MQENLNVSFILNFGDGTVMPVSSLEPCVDVPAWATLGVSSVGMSKYLAQHNYTAVGTYDVSLVADWQNGTLNGTYVLLSNELTVTKYCDPPIVEIGGTGAVKLLATSYKKCSLAKLAAKVTLSCPSTEKAGFQWSVHQIEANDTSPTPYNELNKVTLPESMDITESELVIPKHTLDYGIYNAVLLVIN